MKRSMWWMGLLVFFLSGCTSLRWAPPPGMSAEQAWKESRDCAYPAFMIVKNTEDFRVFDWANQTEALCLKSKGFTPRDEDKDRRRSWIVTNFAVDIEKVRGTMSAW